MLTDEVISAVERGNFHLYSVRTLDKTITLLTGMEAGDRGASGQYPHGTFNALVDQQLREFARHRQQFAREALLPGSTASKRSD